MRLIRNRRRRPLNGPGLPATLIWGLAGRDYADGAFWGSELQVVLAATAHALNAELVGSERWLGVMLPVGGGLLFAVRR